MKRLACIGMMAIGLAGCHPAGDAGGVPTAPTNTVNLMTVTAVAQSGVSGCPMRISFYGTITAKGSGRATYRWELSDGTQTDEQGVVFNNPMVQNGDFVELGQGDINVSGPALTASADGLVWGRLHVLTPQDMSSQPAYWNVVCGR